MTNEELLKQCEESEMLGLPTLGFTVMIPGLRRGQSVRLDKGLSGKNLGHYFADGEKVTMVFLETANVRKYLKGKLN